MSPQQQAMLNQAMLTLSPIEQKMARELKMYGTLVSEDTNIYASQVQGAQEKAAEIAKLMDQNKLSVESAAEVNSKYRETINNSIMTNESFATAGERLGGVYGDAARQMLETQQNNNKYTAEALEKQKKYTEQ